jgi:integrase
VFWFQPPQENGLRPKPFSLEVQDEGEAIRAVLEWRANPTMHAAGKWLQELEGYLREKQAERRLSRFYASSRKTVLLAFAREWGVESPTQVTAEMCQRWYDSMKERNAHTAKHYIVHLRVFLEYLVVRRKVLRGNPARSVRMIRVRQKAKTDFVQSVGVARILARARWETRQAKRMDGNVARARELELMLYMGFDLGARKNEIVEARRAWFDMAPGAVHVSETDTYVPKDGEDRTVPLTARFQRFLAREFPDGLPGPWVIHPKKKRGRQLYRYEPKKALAGFFERAGVMSVHGRLPNMHMMRHSFASNRLIAGASLFRVAKWMGDDQETVQRHYGHLMPQDEEINRGV